MLFSIYDVDGSGAISYKKFSGGLLGVRPSTAASKFARPSTAISITNTHDPEQLALALKDKLATRGARGVIGLQRQFKIMDDDNSKAQV